MAQSNLFQFVKPLMQPIIVREQAEINGRVEGSIDPYLHLTRFQPTFSIDGQWASFTRNNTRVMADVIALDSPLPLKRRPSLRLATGEVPKIGMKKAKNETQMKRINALLGSNVQTQVKQGIAEIMDDVVACQWGVPERLEAIVYAALSNKGVATADPLATVANNVGTGVRIDYGFDPEAMQNCSVAWAGNATTATPMTDISNLVKAARLKGYRLTTAYTDQSTVDAMLLADETRAMVAAGGGVFVQGALAPVPTLEQANTMIRARYGITFVVVDHPFLIERDGIQTPADMWATGQIAFTQNGTIGDLVWTRLVEMDAPVAGIDYSNANEYTLISMYREKNKQTSWEEITESQAMVLPVINPTGIYTLDTVTPTA